MIIAKSVKHYAVQWILGYDHQTELRAQDRVFESRKKLLREKMWREMTKKKEGNQNPKVYSSVEVRTTTWLSKSF